MFNDKLGRRKLLKVTGALAVSWDLFAFEALIFQKKGLLPRGPVITGLVTMINFSLTPLIGLFWE